MGVAKKNVEWTVANSTMEMVKIIRGFGFG